jgi:hypothetical protein
MADIETLRADFNAATQATYDHWYTLGKTREPHPDERLRFVPYHLTRARDDAEEALIGFIVNRTYHLLDRARRSRAIPTRPQIVRLLTDAFAKLERCKMLRELGPELSTASERVEASAACELALKLYRVALAKRGASNISEVPEPRRKRLAVTDGHVRTGRHKVIDGIRVPVVRSSGSMR